MRNARYQCLSRTLRSMAFPAASAFDPLFGEPCRCAVMARCSTTMVASFCAHVMSGRAAGEAVLGHESTCAVIVIDTRTFGISTPSFATALVGGAVVKTVAYSSFMPAKSAGLARSTVT